MPNISTLPETSMVTILHKRAWEGHKYDRELSEKLIEQYGAERGSARVNKLIVEKAWIDPITQAFTRVYTHWVDHTLPWMDKGQRIIASKMLREFRPAHDRLVREAFAKLSAGMQTYQYQIDSAPRRLNGMFKRSDFPNPVELPNLFGIELNFLPVPLDDIRCKGVSQQELDEFNQSKIAEIERAVENANRAAWLRMYAAVSHMVERLAEYEKREQAKAKSPDGKVGKAGIFRDSLVENIRELVDVLPKMNFSGDTELDNMVQQLNRKLAQNDAEVLRNDAGARAKTMAEAQRILKAMQPFAAQNESEAA